MDINKFKIFNKLKSVYRISSVDDRKESSAEHSWSCLILADYFLTEDLDRLKVYELLMYHDVVEIESGDTPFHPNMSRAGQKENEAHGAEVLEKILPEPLNKKFMALFKEFEEQKTKEAKFAKAVDKLDVMIQELDYKQDWEGFTRAFLIENKAHLFEEFPKIQETFNKLLDYLDYNGYLS